MFVYRIVVNRNKVILLNKLFGISDILVGLSGPKISIE